MFRVAVSFFLYGVCLLIAKTAPLQCQKPLCHGKYFAQRHPALLIVHTLHVLDMCLRHQSVTTFMTLRNVQNDCRSKMSNLKWRETTVVWMWGIIANIFCEQGIHVATLDCMINIFVQRRSFNLLFDSWREGETVILTLIQSRCQEFPVWQDNVHVYCRLADVRDRLKSHSMISNDVVVLPFAKRLMCAQVTFSHRKHLCVC